MNLPFSSNSVIGVSLTAGASKRSRFAPGTTSGAVPPKCQRPSARLGPIAPLFVVWFGFGIFPKVISAFLLGFFPVVVATVMGFKSVETDMIDLARSMRAGHAFSVSLEMIHREFQEPVSGEFRRAFGESPHAYLLTRRVPAAEAAVEPLGVTMAIGVRVGSRGHRR